MKTKATIRQEIRAKRRQISPDERQKAAAGLLKQLRQIYPFMLARRVCVYMANDGEMPLQNIAEFLWSRKRQAFLPVLFGRKSRIMHFAPYRKDTRFKTNRFRIPEPAIKIRNLLKQQELDVVLMPLVSFDSNGNRLGMGGGFYDKTFAYLRHRKCWRKPRLVGVAYDIQEVSELPADTWDVPLDYIVTQTRIIKVNEK